MKYSTLPLAIPYPAVQSGGMRAVAIATPDITVPFSRRDISKMPANPPKSAMSTSYIVGLVLARSSVGLSRSRGEMRKYRQDAITLITIIITRFFSESLISAVSLVPRPRPSPKIGPMSGDMSMAPMITGMEFTLRPTDAIMMENTRIQTFGPRKLMLPLMLETAA